MTSPPMNAPLPLTRLCRCTMYHSGLRTQQSVKTLGTIIRAMTEAKEMRMQKAKEIMRSVSMLLLLSSA